VRGQEALDPAPDERHHDRQLAGRAPARLTVSMTGHLVNIY
jgi:hypothetical protein